MNKRWGKARVNVNTIISVGKLHGNTVQSYTKIIFPSHFRLLPPDLRVRDAALLAVADERERSDADDARQRDVERPRQLPHRVALLSPGAYPTKHQFCTYVFVRFYNLYVCVKFLTDL
jgi:hypothetical protein